MFFGTFYSEGIVFRFDERKKGAKTGKDHKPGFDLRSSKVQPHCLSEHCPQGQPILLLCKKKRKYVYFTRNQIDYNKS